MGSIKAASPAKRAAKKTSTSLPRATNGARAEKSRSSNTDRAPKSGPTTKAAAKATSSPTAKNPAKAATGKGAKDPIAADIAFIKGRLGRIKTTFYDVGEALARLSAADAATKLGHATFAGFVRKEIKMSAQLADRLIAIASHVSRPLATEVGQRHAWALVRLTRPTTLADPYPKEKRKKVVLPTGDTLKIPTAAARAGIAEAPASTKAERKKRGRTTTAVERHIGSEIDACLKALGVDKASVRTVATRPGQVANLRIELPLSDLETLCKVVCPK